MIIRLIGSFESLLFKPPVSATWELGIKFKKPLNASASVALNVI